MPNQAGIQEHTDKAEDLAEGYAKIDRHQIHERLFDELEAAAADGKTLRVLDIGAGSGNDAYAIAQMGHEVEAVEPSALLDIAKRDFPHPNITYTDDQLPALEKVSDQKFDVVLMSAVFQYIDPEERVESLKRIGEVLEPGGELVITYPSPPSREHQFEVSEDDFRSALAAANEQLPPHQQLSISGEPEITPDSRGRKSVDGRDLNFYDFKITSPSRAERLSADRETATDEIAR